jgi:hypothetical protein
VAEHPLPDRATNTRRAVQRQAPNSRPESVVQPTVANANAVLALQRSAGNSATSWWMLAGAAALGPIGLAGFAVGAAAEWLGREMMADHANDQQTNEDGKAVSPPTVPPTPTVKTEDGPPDSGPQPPRDVPFAPPKGPSWLTLLPRAVGEEVKDKKDRVVGHRPVTVIDLHMPGQAAGAWNPLIKDPNNPKKKIRVMGTGEDPTLIYNDKIHRLPPKAAEPGKDLDPEQQRAANAALDRVRQARAAIPLRKFSRSANNNAGYDHNPNADPTAKDYNKWIKTARPEGIKEDDADWKIFQAVIPLEGQIGRFTTFDQTLSVGMGFSTAGGAGQAILGRTLALLPEVAEVAFAAGMVIDPRGNTTVVDTDRGWILEGQDAINYILVSLPLLSLIVNISEGTQTTSKDKDGKISESERDRQRLAFLQEQWNEYQRLTLAGITPRVRGWQFESQVLAVHAHHGAPGLFPYTFWDAHDSPDLDDMVAAIYGKSSVWGPFICTGPYAKHLSKVGK